MPVKTMFREAVTPYFTENADLDECISRLKNQLELYVSE